MKELSLHIMDLVQNSIRANATQVEISVFESVRDNVLQMAISDNGAGIPEDILPKVDDPFYTSRTTRQVGLGIPLFKQVVELCNGNLFIDSEEGVGTKLNAVMDLNHIDRQPMGDVAGVLTLLFAANPRIRFIYSHSTDSGSYVIDSAEIRNALGNDAVYELGILKYIKEMINENLKEISVNC